MLLNTHPRIISLDVLSCDFLIGRKLGYRLAAGLILLRQLRVSRLIGTSLRPHVILDTTARRRGLVRWEEARSGGAEKLVSLEAILQCVSSTLYVEVPNLENVSPTKATHT